MGRSVGGKCKWGACWCLFAVTCSTGGTRSLWVEARTSVWSEPSPLGMFGVDARTFQETEATATATVGDVDVNVNVVDLSYQSHVSPDQLVKRLAAEFSLLRAKKEHTTCIDLSNNPGLRMTDMWRSLLSLPSSVLTSMSAPVHISARSCRIQSSDAAACLKQMAQTAKDHENITHTNYTSACSVGVPSLDLGFNPDLGSTTAFSKALQDWILAPTRPRTINTHVNERVLRLDACGLGPAACRAIGEGLLLLWQRSQSKQQSEHANENEKQTPQKPCLISLYLGQNEAIGNAGVCALAAALRSGVCLNVLDLSACEVGDAGAQALAMALEDNPGCIRSLILRNNRHVTDKGVAFLGRGLQAAAAMADANAISPGPQLQHLDVSHNTNIGTIGAIAIAQAMAHGALHSASMCSCSIGADGASAFGAAAAAAATSTKRNSNSPACRIYIDLSGNPLGIFRPPSKKKNGALLMKSKASATTKTYVNFIGKKIQTGLKDYAGLDTTTLMGTSTVESDDDEDDDDDNEEGQSDNKNDNKKLDASKARCGAKSFVDAVLSKPVVTAETESKEGSSMLVVVGMRHCALDEGAADALAAAIQHQGKKQNVQWHMDTSMNAGLSDHSMAALWNVDEDSGNDHVLEEMAQRHLAAMEAFQRARERVDAERALLNARNPWDRQTTYEDYDDYDTRDDHAFGNNDDQYDNIYGNDEYDSDEYNY